jgi:enoyl-CoA hydratase
MSDDAILVERRQATAILTINRPKSLNALDAPTLRRLEEALDAVERDEAVRVILVTGAGERAFVAGGDIGDLNSRQGLAHYLEFAELVHRVFRRFESCDKPTIAAVNGWALGGGTELVLALDLRLLADTAKLGLPEINLGLFPGAGGTQRIMRQVPACRAKEIMFTGDRIGAEEAVAIGLANRVVPREKLMEEALALADKIAGKSSLILKLLKRTLRHGADMPLAAALPYEQAMIGLVLDSKDAHEGCTAFLEKRVARFTGS